MKKGTAGFTLVELIVVIAILGILAGIAIPVYSGYISKANEAADYQQLDAIKTAATFAATEAARPDGLNISTIVVTADAQGTISKIVVNGTKTDSASTAYVGTFAASSDATKNAVETLLGGSYPTLKADSFKGKTITFTQSTGKWTAA